MKTMKLRLLATMITLAAVTITTTNPATAQRRSTSTENTRNERVVKTDSKSKSAVEKKSTTRNTDNKSNSEPRSVRNNTQKRSSPAPETTQKRAEPATKSSRISTTTDNRSTKVVTGSSNQNNREVGSNPGSNVNRNTSKSSSNAAVNNRSVSGDTRDGRIIAESGSRSATIENSNRGSRNSATSEISSRNREKYRIDENDRRYSPSRDYRGSNSYWSGNNRPDRLNYNRDSKRFYRNYDYNHYTHWDRSWESYRWNFNSWSDYYSGYNPYSYRYYRYYYHHPYYGHVIRRFVNPPMMFIHNHINYYCYDGHFFRYQSGIGYVLVDMPYGMVFEYIPVGYERVYINGYPYFRVGNLFFEFDNFGFHLVHYPERYYSINISFSNNGFSF